ncbi:MAG TPA: metalloregulator ArsR/SmtB family transcription factor [Flavobacterium sp.]|nr:metalloregulator ArsR/SmtB family transcription factor [Flavobacterium sp.]
MGTTKHLDFDKETNAIAEICKALGHPTRMQIMTLLWKKNDRTCGEIVALIPLAQSTISKHLLELKKANLLNVKNEGKKTIYSIEVDKIQILKKYLTNYLSNRAISNEKETIVIKTNAKKKKEDKIYLKQYNYQFPDKKTKKD